MAPKEEKNQYDAVFDFIFGVQKSKRNKAFPKPSENMSTYSTALIDIGTQPLVYPLESSFRAINKYIEKATEIDLGEGMKAGFGGEAFSSPDAASKKNISREKAKNSWARVGGALHYGIDGALISLYAKNNGASSKVAYGAGSLFSDVLKEKISKGNDQFWGFQTDEEIAGKQDEFFRRGVDLRATSIAKSDPRINKAWLLRNISDGQKIPSKTERIRKTAELLRMQGLDPREGLEVAYSLWGDPKGNDLGLFKTDDDPVRKKLMPLSSDRSKMVKVYSSLGIQDERGKMQEVYKILKSEYGLDPRAAMVLSKEICTLQRNNGIDIANSSVYFALAKDVTRGLVGREDYSKIPAVQKRIAELLDPNGKSTLGMKAARAVTVANWLSSSGAWGNMLFEGNWEKFGVDDLNFTKIVEKQKITKDGKETDLFYYKGANTVMGRLLGDSYYFHPNNLIKGLFFDGDLWLKWASNAKGELNTKSFAYFMYSMRLNEMLGKLTSPFKFVSSGALKVLNPMAVAVKTFIKNILTKVIGATGLAGLVVNLLMNIVSEKVAYVLNQIMIAIILGMLGFMFILMESRGIFYSEEKVESVMDNLNIENEESDGRFTDEDFVIPE